MSKRSTVSAVPVAQVRITVMPICLDESISWRRLPGPDHVQPMGQLCEQGQPTGVHLPGAVLEAAARVPLAQGLGLLLFLTDDAPYEEALRLVLLSPSHKVLDQVELGGAYTTGSFSGLQVLAPDTLGFRFICDVDWSVQVLPQAQWVLPWVMAPRGVSRVIPWRRQMVLRGQPKAGVGCP